MAGRPQDAFEHRTGGTLAVGAGHHDAGAGELQRQPLRDLAHARESHLDGRMVQPLDTLQPAFEFGHLEAVLCDRIDRLSQQQREQTGQLVAHLTAVHDHVDRAVLKQELRALESFR